MASPAYVPGDHESGLGRDVILAPPTCCSSCCCCCCCTLAAPELYGGTKFARETSEAHEARGARATFWDAQLSFAAGALVFSLAASPIAGALGFALFLSIMSDAATGVALLVVFGLVLATLVIGVLVQTTRLGARHGTGEVSGLAGFGCGILVLGLLAAAIAGEIALVIFVVSAGDPGAALVAAGSALVVAPTIAAGWKRRRDARDLAAEAGA